MEEYIHSYHIFLEFLVNLSPAQLNCWCKFVRELLIFLSLLSSVPLSFSPLGLPKTIVMALLTLKQGKQMAPPLSSQGFIELHLQNPHRGRNLESQTHLCSSKDEVTSLLSAPRSNRGWFTVGPVRWAAACCAGLLPVGSRSPWRQTLNRRITTGARWEPEQQGRRQESTDGEKQETKMGYSVVWVGEFTF